MVCLVSGSIVPRDGVCEWRRSHVSNPRGSEVSRVKGTFLFSRGGPGVDVPSSQWHYLSVSAATTLLC